MTKKNAWQKKGGKPNLAFSPSSGKVGNTTNALKKMEKMANPGVL